jgi:hypothetical protein
LQRCDHQLAQLGDRGLTVFGLDAFLERLQAEQDRCQRLPGLVVELARQPSALDFLRLYDAADGISAHPLGERRGRSERAQQR